MRHRTRLTRFGWRWRRNPLRRGTDIVEALLVVVTTVLFCATPAVGWWAGRSVDHDLQRVVRAQGAARTLVTATVEPGRPAASDRTDPAPGSGDVLRWTAPDHSVHTATVPSDLEVPHRGRILLWTDRKGALVTPPLDPATATSHGVLAGMAAASGTAGLVLIIRQLLMWRLMLRRMASWEREWNRFGQDWGRAGAGG